MKPWLSIVCVLWLGTNLAAAQAQAQVQAKPAADGAKSDAERDRQARSEFERGRRAFDDGDYRAAWASFHNAYRLSNRAQLLFNIGQTADRLGFDSDALTAFRMYLDRLPEAENRRDVENRIRALEERVKEASAAAGAPATRGQLEAGADPLAVPPGAAPDHLPAPEASTSLPVAAGGGDSSRAQVDASVPPQPRNLEPRPTRRGVYARLSLGAGFRRDGLSGGNDGSVVGLGFAGELAVATTLWPGFVLGGMISSDLASSPKFESQTGASFTLGSAHMTMLGPYADWYLRPRDDGFHVQAALTFAVLSIDYIEGSGRGSIGRDASGIGAMIGAGYEWPIASEVALGVLGRITLASLNDEMRSHGIFAPSILASVTWY